MQFILSLGWIGWLDEIPNVKNIAAVITTPIKYPIASNNSLLIIIYKDFKRLNISSYFE